MDISDAAAAVVATPPLLKTTNSDHIRHSVEANVDTAVTNFFEEAMAAIENSAVTNPEPDELASHSVQGSLVEETSIGGLAFETAEANDHTAVETKMEDRVASHSPISQVEETAIEAKPFGAGESIATDVTMTEQTLPNSSTMALASTPASSHSDSGAHSKVSNRFRRVAVEVCIPVHNSEFPQDSDGPQVGKAPTRVKRKGRKTQS
jgi:hypothetical protein